MSVIKTDSSVITSASLSAWALYNYITNQVLNSDNIASFVHLIMLGLSLRIEYYYLYVHFAVNVIQDELHIVMYSMYFQWYNL